MVIISRIIPAKPRNKELYFEKGYGGSSISGISSSSEVGSTNSQFWELITTDEDGNLLPEAYIKTIYPVVSAQEITAFEIGGGIGGGSGVTALSALTDVTLTSAVAGNVLIYNGTHWENKPQSAIVPDLSPYALKSYVDTKVADLVATAPAALDTLNELATALGNDPNFATTISTQIGTKVTANAAITGATKTKITYDSKGLVTGGADLIATDIPNLDAAKITTGTFALARIPTGTSGTTVALGNHTHAQITVGAYLTGTNYNGSTASTFAVDATSVNTANKVVARDASGNFAAGTITATLSGNASTATKISTTTPFSIGGSTGLSAAAINFDGSQASIALQLAGQLNVANGGTGLTDTKDGFTRRVTGLIPAVASHPVVHGLGNRNVIAQVVQESNGEVVECDILIGAAGSGTVTFVFNVAPAANKYRYIIIG